MPCCGKKRAGFLAGDATPRGGDTAGSTSVHGRPVASAVTYFQYTGKTALTAIGPLSRQRYRFGGPGAVVEVDARDAPSLAAVPNLRQLKNPPAVASV